MANLIQIERWSPEELVEQFGRLDGDARSIRGRESRGERRSDGRCDQRQ